MVTRGEGVGRRVKQIKEINSMVMDGNYIFGDEDAVEILCCTLETYVINQCCLNLNKWYLPYSSFYPLAHN